MSHLAIFDSLNIAKQCRKYHLPLWQCPHFLVIVLGMVVIVSSLAIYFIGSGFSDNPELIVLIVLGVSAFLVVIGFSIIHSFERLADLARMKSEFISIVSHQLRSPLANLRWIIDLLISGKAGETTEKQVNYFQLLRESGQRMDDIVNDLLVVSRLENNEFPLKSEKGSLVEAARKTVDRLTPLALASNVKINFQAENNLPETCFDSLQIGQVIENLLSNAIRYISGQGSVDVGVKRSGDCISVEIKDNGIGIDAADQKYIFEKFFRGRNASGAQAQGSGLGLYIAKSIIEKSGGKIGFTSEINKGTTFWFTLPISTK